ncbi:MAG: hypothetical protein ACFFDT_00160 [Candidatus Hodarchaeota archaeon]
MSHLNAGTRNFLFGILITLFIVITASHSLKNHRCQTTQLTKIIKIKAD